MSDSRGRFGDPEVEKAFRLTERQSKISMVRLYGAVTLAVMLTYALINPLFFSWADEVRFTINELAGYQADVKMGERDGG